MVLQWTKSDTIIPYSQSAFKLGNEVFWDVYCRDQRCASLKTPRNVQNMKTQEHFLKLLVFPCPPPMPYDLTVAMLTRNFSFPNLCKYSGCLFYYCFALSKHKNACVCVHTCRHTHVNTHFLKHERDLERVTEFLYLKPSCFPSILLYTFFTFY